MITPQTIVVGVQPTITAATFAQVLKAANSPAAGAAQAMYDAIAAQEIDPAFLLGCFWEESHYATDPDSVVARYQNFNMGNCRTSRIGITETVTDPEKGVYVKYSDWQTGAKDAAYRLVDKGYNYAKAGATTIGEIIQIWAPKEDQNDPVGYVQTVVNLMNKWVSQGSSNTMEIIDLSSNTPSSVYSDRKGFTVQELILHDTSGQNDNNNASQAACQNALDATIRWFQGNGGVSIHYLIGPENLGGKIYRLCKESVAAYHAVGNKGSIGGVSKDNLISIGIERFGQPNESVGPNQRNAMLWLVSDICGRHNLSANQVISHMSIQSDRRDGGVLLEAARQVVINGGLNYVTTDNQKPVIQPDTVVINQHVLGGGFKQFYDKLTAVSPNFQLLTFGLPVTNEFDCDVNGDGKSFTVQLFERSGLIYEAANSSPWDVHAMTTSQLENALAAAKAKALIN